MAFYPLDGSFSDVTGRQGDLSPSGMATLDSPGLRVQGFGNGCSMYFDNSAIFQAGETRAITVEARLFINSYDPYAQENILSLMKSWDVALSLINDPWQGSPEIYGGGANLIIGGADLSSVLTLGQWHRVNIAINTSGYVVTIDGREIIHQSSSDLLNWAGSDSILVEAGNFDGWLQDLTVKNIQTVSPPRMVQTKRLTDGSVRCTFAGTTGISYTVLASSNLRDWTDVGFAQQVSPGTFQFTDTSAKDFPRRFYRLRVQ